MLKSTKSILFNLSVVIVFSLVHIQCTNHSKAKLDIWDFDSIQSHNELFLIQTDDKYGEWGGDTYFFRMYRSMKTKQLLIDYTEYQGKVGSIPPSDPNSNLKINWFTGQPTLFEKRGINASDEHLNLITNAIQEIISTRINNDEVITMSGIVNRVIYSDSSLIIENYPSNNWGKFHILRNKMKNE